MADLKTCKEKLGRIRLALAAPDGASDEGVCRVLQSLAGSDKNERVYIFAQLAPDVLVTACRGGVMEWWEALAAQTYFGRLAELRALHAALSEDLGKGTKPDLSSTMTWGCWNFAIIEGIPPALRPGVLDQIFEWGADPAYSGNDYYDKALRTAPADIIQSFLRHGAAGQKALTVRDELLTKGNGAQALEIQRALGFGGFFAKVDNQTLMETKYISEPGRNSTLRTIFNFGAGRVNEIFETSGAASTMNSCNFDDYNRQAIEAARQTLEKLGGTPEPPISFLDKKKLPRP